MGPMDVNGPKMSEEVNVVKGGKIGDNMEIS
jgi:hypothetical protein